MSTDPTVCRATVLLPLALVAAALDLEQAPGGAELSDVEQQPACEIQHPHDGVHYGLVMNLNGLSSGAVWAVWEGGGAPHLVVLPDCPVATADGMDACCAFEAHPGGHTWQLHDPLLRFAQQAIAAIPLTHQPPEGT